MNLLAIVKGADDGMWYHIYPFSKAKNCNKLVIVRNRKFTRKINKSEWYHYKNKSTSGSIISIIILSLKAFIDNKIDLIVTFNVFPWGILSFMIAKITNKPILLGFIGTDFNYYLKYSKFKNLIKFVIKKSDIITVTGQNMMDYLINSLGIKKSKIIIFPHCIENSWFETKKSYYKEFDLIHVSKLDKVKKIEKIIEAVYLLKLENRKVKLCIVGDGPEKEFLQSKVLSYDLQNEVEFVGYTNDVADYLLKGKIYIQSSKTEGLSFSLVEAMVIGLVPIVTNAGSEKDHIIHNHNGLYFDYGNVNDLKEKIELLLIDNNYNIYKKNVLNYRRTFRMNNAINVSEKIISSFKNLK